MLSRTLVALLPLLFSSLALSATFSVTNTNADGPGSLRQAILDANATAGPPHVIEFDDALTGSINPIGGVSDLPTLAVSMSIIGPGPDEATIDLGQHGPLTVGPGASAVTIAALSLTGGTAPRGGCLNNEFGAELVVTEMDFSFCLAVAAGSEDAEGGALYSAGPTEITDARFISNFALGGSTGSATGGAVKIDFPQGHLTVRNSEFIANGTSVDSEVSGIFSSGGAVAQFFGGLEITNSRFAFNAASEAGDGNKDASGGALSHLGDNISIRATTFASNTANGGGSAVRIFNGGGGINNSASLENVVFYDNRGNLGERLNNGAALSVGRSTLRLRNSTFFANSSGSGASSLFHSSDLDNLAISNNAFGKSADGTPSCRSVTSPDDGFTGAFNFFTDSSCDWLASAGTQHASLSLFAVGEDSTFSSPDVLPIMSSPLVDGGSPATSPSDFSVCAETDVTGALRPVDNNGDGALRCTSGAFEQLAADDLFADRFEAP